ncbi:Re/Si-specific NAD(P)(+) transhydrogenase subunit alpha [Legionella impletisoli]|uniref:NAD(P) transhydrogenase subunit alpha part 1 n=2 Tax=Bacteria TaxID=2 RepID=A0A917JPM2_9GAMM|nr:Re/Si-specific NAD(P)(+) transhydrogenase subunit alpha [Legionella impletisoli]GGI78569.1 pyridine nucleotide transhydrogenase subunit alpha [Legionella impletisoli]
MYISALNEGGTETRVAISPTSVKQFLKLGLNVLIETHAGIKAGFSDEDYTLAGAEIMSLRKTLLSHTHILATVGEPLVEEINDLPPESLLIGQIDKNSGSSLIKWCLKHRVSVFSMNLIPRISRAQSMDALSSQANLAGYRAVIEGVAHYQRAIPMMMTAAGMIQPAKVLILGAGVAGLQAIATAKRLGAVVYAFDVRRAAKEQVESLGAEFIEVSEEYDAETASGYATEVSDEYRLKQAELIHDYARLADIIICTALIPNKKAPLLLKADTVELMKAGSVIVDLATSRGGNCELSEQDQIIKHNQVTIIGYSNMAGLIPATASDLYANNIANFLKLLDLSEDHLSFNDQDEIIQQGMLCHDGQFEPFQYTKETA